MKFKKTILVFFFFSLCTTGICNVTLPRLISDGMVLQRDQKIKIWGWADANEKVSVTFNKKKYSTTTLADGTWSVVINPTKAGGPHRMQVTGNNTITIENILVGDVWICAGQSNMVHSLKLHQERYATEIAQASNPQIRNFTIPTTTNLIYPSTDITQGSWKETTPQNVMDFSVVAYFFAKKLNEQYHVPIGIINASVGGTPIEAWISEGGLKTFPEIITTIQQNKDTAYVNNTNRRAQAVNRAWEKRNATDQGLVESPRWHDTTYIPSDWHSINIPGYWEDQGIKNLDGVVWYRREIEIPQSLTGLPAKVALGRIVDADVLYINGVQVGNTTYQYPQRRYSIAEGILKPGKNVFVIRVINNGGKGGFVPDKPYHLSIGNQLIDLKGYWHYKVGQVFERREFVPSIAVQNQPTTLFNGMIAPLINYAVKGFVWYQGESNTGKPDDYSKLLPALITDWRNQWKQNTTPFLYAQLPNFMDVNYSPEESNWAALRNAQLKTLSVANTGMAVTIDLGEWNDIHPGNKKPVGERLALAARNVAYGEAIIPSGPIYQSSTSTENKIVISFTNVGSGLISKDGKSLRYFAIAGADKKFVWANAEIKNNTVVVWSDQIAIPQFVRYAWADNPDGANLTNKEGLMASPFTTEK